MAVLDVFRKAIVCLCAVSAIAYFCAYFCLSEHSKHVPETIPLQITETISLKTSETVQKKVILSWTGFFKHSKFVAPAFEKLGCKMKNCYVTRDRDMLNSSQAVIFHWPDVNTTDLPEKVIGQRWFMFSFESPVHTPSRRSAADPLGSRIDHTITYRLDSDIVATYGKHRPRTNRDVRFPIQVPSQSQFESRSKIAWMVSHCRTHGKRETIAKSLRSLIKVDVYGKCGGKRLMLKWSRDKAYKYLASRYLFYLAFENALCKDYITEKVFMPLHYGMIPVVYGGAKYAKHLPPNSYIDILEFPTLQKLVEFLNSVSSNYTLYASYFDWRKNYVISKRSNDNSFFCEVCHKLNTDSSKTKLKRSGWFRRWWYNSNECINVHRANVQRLNLLRNVRRSWY